MSEIHCHGRQSLHQLKYLKLIYQIFRNLHLQSTINTIRTLKTDSRDGFTHLLFNLGSKERKYNIEVSSEPSVNN